jgi:hypothetical protein
MTEPSEELKETLLGLFSEVAIIEHLARTRIERNYPTDLGAHGFGVINYFVRNHNGPDSIAGIAWAFQDDEVYTAEKIAALESRGYVSVSPPGSRAPEAMVNVTEAGRKAQAEQLNRMAPEFGGLVAEISLDDLKTTQRTLHEIRLTLDNLPDR